MEGARTHLEEKLGAVHDPKKDRVFKLSKTLNPKIVYLNISTPYSENQQSNIIKIEKYPYVLHLRKLIIHT